MKKYGEIKRFTINGLTYIVESDKIEGVITPELHIPFLVIGITKKSAKKKKGKNFSKNALHFGLINEMQYSTIKKLISIIKEYLDIIKPKYIAFSIYYEFYYEKESRLKFYTKRLKEMGYEYFGKDDEVYYFQSVSISK